MIACRIPENFGASPTSSAGGASNQQAVASGTTDANGQVELHDPQEDYVLEVETRDAQAQLPIANVRVWSLSQGDKLLVIAIDESGEYAPYAKEYNQSELSQLSGGHLARPGRQVISLAVVLLLVKAVSIYQNAAQWAAFVQDFPEIENWDSDSRDLCVNPRQKELGTQALIGTGLLVMSPGGAFGASDDYVAAIGTVVDELFQEGVNDGIAGIMRQQPPAIERWRIYTLATNIPYFARFLGFCLDPIDRTDLQSALDWVRYAMGHNDDYPLQAIVVEDVYSTPQITVQGSTEISKELLLNELNRRLTSHPQCSGIYSTDFGMIVWTTGWSPLWDVEYSNSFNFETTPGQNANVAFQFFMDDGAWRLSHLFIPASRDELEYLSRGPVSPVFHECDEAP